MKKKDLLLLLQDFVEENGMFNYIRIHYTEYRPYELDTIKKIVLKGLSTGLLEIDYSIKNLKKKTILNTKTLDLDAATAVVSDDASWHERDDIYEVTFSDVNKYIWVLFGDEVGDEQRVPEEFIEFVID